LLQNIQVLSAGQDIQKDPEGKPRTVQVVNLLVDPGQAEVLSLASNEARIQLILRNPLDTEVAKTTGTAMANLFSGAKMGLPTPPPPTTAWVPRPAPVVAKVEAPPVIAPEPPKVVMPITVEVYTGTKRVDSKFTPKEEKP
jgi:pilus assembly protein CpaB